MGQIRQTFGLLAAFALITGLRCGALSGVEGADCMGFEPTNPEIICVTGTVRHFAFEGGFWAVRGDDSTTYDPLGGLPASFQREGLRVRLEARIRSDVGSFHMAGPIVEILDIRELSRS